MNGTTAVARRIVGTVLVALLGACGGDDATATDTGSTLDGDITVFAAASLTDAFEDVVARFEHEHSDVSVTVSFAGSSSLREQILDGAPADVFASADPSNMDRLIDAGEIVDATVFARNRLQIVVPAGNPGRIEDLHDFAEESLLIGLCAAEVPCGQFGRAVLDAAGVEPAVDTNEPDVRALLTKVAENELDAGIVYVTDVVAEGDAVEGIDIPEEIDVVAAYPIGTVDSSPNPELATAFIDFVLGDTGRAILTEHGFASP